MPGVVQATACTSVVHVDSAVRWRRNGAVGLRNCLFCRAVFLRRFFSFCGFAIRRVARAAANLRFWFGRDTGTGFLSDAVDRWRKYSRAEVRGASFASLRVAGLRLARLKPVFSSISRGHPEHLFSPLSCVAASCLFQSAAELANNVQVMGISRSLTLRPGPVRAKSATPAAGPGEYTKNEYCRLIDSSAPPQNDNGGIEFSKKIH